ncbi:Uncharacterised protein [uncultured archaeon]|nr:Uncharacterised protein [uncultured archaeon]
MNLPKVTLILVILFLSSPFGLAQNPCDNFPNEDLHILTDETVINVTPVNYLQGSYLPTGWEILSQGLVDEKIFEDSVRKDGIVATTDFLPQKFTGAYSQVLYTGTDKLYVLIESFTSEEYANNVLNKYYPAYREAGNIHNFDSIQEIGRRAFICQFEGTHGTWVMKFIDKKNRLIEIDGSKKEDLESIGQAYDTISSSVSTTSTHKWEAYVCKPNTDACTQHIYFSPIYEDVELTECRTYKNNDTITCPDRRIEKYASSITVPFPSCEKGDILSLSYTKDTQFPIKGRIWSPTDFYLQDEYPSQNIVLDVIVPKSMNLQYDSAISPQITNEGEQTTYRWAVHNVGPLKTEPYMPKINEVVPTVTFSSVALWSEVKEWATPLFNESIDSDAVKSILPPVVSPSDSKNDKITKIYEWVRDQVRYEESEIGFLTGYKPHQTKEILNYRFGDCKDKTVLLASMLKANDIPAYPVIVSRSDINKKVPTPYAFYHAIIAISNGTNYIWLDPTCSFCPAGYLPPSEQDVDVLILADHQPEFIKTPVLADDEYAQTENNYSIEVHEDGRADIFLTSKSAGYSALILRKQLNERTNKELEELLVDMVTPYCSNFQSSSHRILDSDSLLSLTLEVRGTCKKFADVSGEKLIYNMPHENLYTSVATERRVFPIQIDKDTTEKTKVLIAIPANYAVEVIPQNYAEKTSFGNYEFNCKNTDKLIECDRFFHMNKTTLAAGDFTSFNEFFKGINTRDKAVILSHSSSSSSYTPSTTSTAITQTTEHTLQSTTQSNSSSPPADKNEVTTAPSNLSKYAVFCIAAIIILAPILKLSLNHKKHKPKKK